MKYIFGSLIISFGFIFVAMIIMMTLQIKPSGTVLQYTGIAWLILVAACYPVAKKIVR